MASPTFQPSSTPVPIPITAPSSRTSTPRLRAYTTTVDAHGAVCKRDPARSRTLSGTQADRLYRLAAEQQQQQQPPSHLGGVQWLTPQHSPVPSALSADPSCEPFPAWTVPTPPRSDSGFPTVSLDANDDPVVTTALCTSAEFHDYEPPTASAEMSSLGYLLPSQYGASLYESESNGYPMDQAYNMPPMRVSQPAGTSGPAAYAQSITSSPVPYQSTMARRPDAPTSQPPYTRSPYDSPASNYSVAAGQSIPPISGLTHGALPSPPMSSSGTPMMPQYSATSMPRSPALYDQNVYTPPFTSAAPGPQMYASMPAMGYAPPYVGDMMAAAGKPLVAGSDGNALRALNARPKPQCWEHGCNGRQFSTFSNLLRHQREKSGTANKAYCPKCGAEFTRTTARNGHLAHDKCTKNRRSTDSK